MDRNRMVLVLNYSAQAWLIHTLETLMLPTGPAEDWFKFERRDPALSTHARLYFALHEISLPEGIPELTLPWSANGTPMTWNSSFHFSIAMFATA